MERKLNRDRKFKVQKLAKTKTRRKGLEAQRRQSDLCPAAIRNDLLPDLTIINVDVTQLLPASRRTRRLNEDHIERLMISIADLGFTVPILVADSTIIDGHVRLEAARRLGLPQVPAIDVSHLSPAERRKLALAANRLGELGEWDLDELRIEFAELIELDVDLTSTGFTLQEQDIILLDPLEAAGVGEDEDEPPDPPEDPVTRLGDVWLCGEHRVICGNALEEPTYKALLMGETAHCVLSDPPYNVPIQGNVSGLGKKVHQEFAMASGEMNDEEWQAFLDKLLALLASFVEPGSVLFLFMDWRSIHRLYQAGFTAKLKLVNLVAWFKEAGAMGALYRSAHELIAVFCKGDTPRTNNVELGKHGRDRKNVWVAPGANRRGSSANEMLHLHATPKPVELCVDALLDVTNRGEIVLDAFLGSGTTLIAAEKSGRICRGIELEPKFVDVSVMRWIKLTGGSPILEATGETFDEVAVRRRARDDDSQSDGTKI
jgi:DNA modification methylase